MEISLKNYKYQSQLRKYLLESVGDSVSENRKKDLVLIGDLKDLQRLHLRIRHEFLGIKIVVKEPKMASNAKKTRAGKTQRGRAIKSK